MNSVEKMIMWDGWFRYNNDNVSEWMRSEQMDRCAPLTTLWSR